MAKIKTIYTCQNCGYQSPRWLGRCTCGAWDSFVEETVGEAPKEAVSLGRSAFGALQASRVQRLVEVEVGQTYRNATGLKELDRVLGGGLVPGALVLVGGDPGIGKSTLLLQAAECVARMGVRVLYVTGEESPRQVRLRAERVSARSPELWLLAETSLEAIERQVDELKPQMLVIDSIQTLWAEGFQSAPGSVGQLRTVTAQLMSVAKGKEIPIFLIGHVTKDGAIAGPRVLEHMVDTVLYFQGERGHPIRFLRAVKNRFGSTDEVGAFEMTEQGVREVENPSAVFLAERAVGASGSVVAAAFEGSRAVLVEVQALVTPAAYGTGRRTAIGVDGGRLALLLAVLEKKAGLVLGQSDVYVNLAGGARFDEPALDLAILAALASSHLDRPIPPDMAVFGEVGLGGEVRSVTGGDARISEIRQMGLKRVLCPVSNSPLHNSKDSHQKNPALDGTNPKQKETPPTLVGSDGFCIQGIHHVERLLEWLF